MKETVFMRQIVVTFKKYIDAKIRIEVQKQLKNKDSMTVHQQEIILENIDRELNHLLDKLHKDA